MAATLVDQAHHLNQHANPNHDPALTGGGGATTHQPHQETEHAASLSPPPQDDQEDDFEIDVDTRKHMEAPRNHEGKMICVRAGCESMRFDRKCEWSKHMDKHDRPYRCPDPACAKLKGFTYSGGLLRHQREVHKKHGGPKDQLTCPIPYCKRNNGPGFTRKENLNEHIRRVHRQPVPKEPEDGTSKRRERRSLKRSAAALEAEEVAASENQHDARNEEVPVDTALMAVDTNAPHAGQPAPQANMAGERHTQEQAEHPSTEAKHMHPYPQAESMAVHPQQAQMDHHAASVPMMTPEQAQQLAQQQQQVHHSAVPHEFQFGAAGALEAREHELTYLRSQVERLQQECEEKDQRIAQLEAGLASMQHGVQHSMQQGEGL